MTVADRSKTERRKIEEVLVAQSASDGDGVRLKRVFGGGNLARFDPFLMLDEFGSNDPSDYIGGFPSHPHRGFETVTYMLEGHMEHRDHMGNVGQLMAGDVQWMKAGSGVIHSEMPKQVEGTDARFSALGEFAREREDDACKLHRACCRIDPSLRNRRDSCESDCRWLNAQRRFGERADCGSCDRTGLFGHCCRAGAGAFSRRVQKAIQR